MFLVKIISLFYSNQSEVRDFLIGYLTAGPWRMSTALEEAAKNWLTDPAYQKVRHYSLKTWPPSLSEGTQ
jgi:hypothetical protein